VEDKRGCDLVYGIMEREVIVAQWRLSCDRVEEMGVCGYERKSNLRGTLKLWSFSIWSFNL
jgi:hypothetical protein